MIFTICLIQRNNLVFKMIPIIFFAISYLIIDKVTNYAELGLVAISILGFALPVFYKIDQNNKNQFFEIFKAKLQTN